MYIYITYIIQISRIRFEYPSFCVPTPSGAFKVIRTIKLATAMLIIDEKAIWN